VCAQASEFWELGLEPIPISAITGSGTGEMLDALVKVSGQDVCSLVKYLGQDSIKEGAGTGEMLGAVAKVSGVDARGHRSQRREGQNE